MTQITGIKPAPDSSPTTSEEICYVVDDDASMRKSISRLLELEGFKVLPLAIQRIFSMKWQQIACDLLSWISGWNG